MRELFERAAGAAALSYRDLQIILDAVPTSLSWATLPEGRIRFMNRSFTKTFGYREDDFANVQDWIEKTYVRAQDRRSARENWQRLWAAQAAGISEVGALEIQLRCCDGRIVTVQHRGILLHDIGVGIATFEDITDRKQAEDALRRIAWEDSLTGLPNRRALQERWGETVASLSERDGLAGILLIDLDGFKVVNDRLGHDAGDEALVAVAARLKESVRASDLVCRIGGDEFAVLLAGLRNTAELEQVCWRIGTVLARPLTVQGRAMSIGASIGASLYPQDGDNLRDLLKRADEAMYRLKGGRKGGWAWYNPPSAA